MPSGQWAVIRKLARTVKPPPEQRVTKHRHHVVDHITPAGSVDGVTAVFVTAGGDVFPAPYLDSYDAAAAVPGDMVRVAFDDGSPIILGRVVGLPDLS